MTPQVGDIWCFEDRKYWLLTKEFHHDSFEALSLTSGRRTQIMLLSRTPGWRFVA
jgi:hypothetical protein